MSSGLHYSCIFFFQFIIIQQCLWCCRASCGEIAGRHKNGMQRDTEDNHLPISSTEDSGTSRQRDVNEMHDHEVGSFYYRMDLVVNVFFRVEDLKFGNKFPIYFSIKEPSKRPPLLSKKEADSIPFSSSQLPYLLKLFSISPDSIQAKAMEGTLALCESAAKGEANFCVTSLESMLDSARELFGLGTPLEVLNTHHLNNQISSVMQNYTIMEEPRVMSATKMLPCHSLAYPYAVFYCHRQKSSNYLFKLSLVGDNGDRVNAVAICHMDTTEWDENHIAFLVLKAVPRKSPVCHCFPAGHLVWISKTSAYV